MKNIVNDFKLYVIGQVEKQTDPIYRKLFEQVFGEETNPVCLLEEDFSNIRDGFAIFCSTDLTKEIGADYETCQSVFEKLTQELIKNYG